MLVILLEILFILVSILLIFIILIQPARGEGGIAGAFGGGMSESFFGTRAHQQINRFTIWLALAALALALLINMSSSKSADGSVAPSAPPAKGESQ